MQKLPQHRRAPHSPVPAGASDRMDPAARPDRRVTQSSHSEVMPPSPRKPTEAPGQGVQNPIAGRALLCEPHVAAGGSGCLRALQPALFFSFKNSICF